jgi:hypothetical protein
MDTKIQARLEECKELTKLLTHEPNLSDELRKSLREQLRGVGSKLWGDHQKYMGPYKEHRECIWHVLNGGLAALIRA